jgi:hypothetical protein
MKIITTFLLSLVMLAFSGIVSALSISIYDQPNQNAKVVGTADLSTGIIPIFTPEKGGDWMKIADPRKGNVGWIKTSDLKGAKGSDNGSVTFTQKIITTDQAPQSFQIIQFGNSPTQLTDQQVQAFMQKMKVEQQALQQSFQGLMKNMNEVIQRQWNMWNTQGGFPMIIIPAPTGKQTAPVATPVKQTTTTKTSTVTGSTPEKKSAIKQ